nr:hypothetical protein BDOA9_0116870 [Bradyrhizobium sp. DOA9]
MTSIIQSSSMVPPSALKRRVRSRPDKKRVTAPRDSQHPGASRLLGCRADHHVTFVVRRQPRRASIWINPPLADLSKDGLTKANAARSNWFRRVQRASFWNHHGNR